MAQSKLNANTKYCITAKKLHVTAGSSTQMQSLIYKEEKKCCQQ